MKKLSGLFWGATLTGVLGMSGVACSEVERWDPLVPDDPREVGDIKGRAGISDDDFCCYIDIENINRTIPVVNRYIDNLPVGLNAEQKAKALVALYRSFNGITDARLFQNEYMRTPDVLFSFMDGSTNRELTLELSSMGKILSYHYDVTTGAYAKVDRYVTIDKVFGFINSLDFEVKEIMHGVYVSSRPSSEAELQRILDGINAKDYTHEEGWLTTGYLHYLTNKITIFPHLAGGMHNKTYQADWLGAMREYGLTETFDYDGSGYAVEFLIPENATIPESHWKKIFAKYDNILDVVELNYNRYTLADDTMEGGYGDDIVAVDSKIHIRPVEIYNTSPRTFQLYCATEKQYGSGSYPIITTKSRSGDTIDISFKGVPEKIGFGYASIGPARSYIDLGHLDEGTYSVNLYNGGVKHMARLVVAAGSYSFEMADNPTFGFVGTLNRIPEQTIWGNVSYMSNITQTIAESFLRDIAAIGAENRAYAPGYYLEFEIDGNGDVVQPEPHNPDHPRRDRYFVFHYSGDLGKVDRLIRQYLLESEKDNLYISVYTDKGEQFLSWMYDRDR